MKTKWPVRAELDGDLGGLIIANLADHDLVGVVAQNGAKAAGKREALLFVHRDLSDAAQLVLDGVLDGDDLVLIGANFIEGGVQGGRLAAAGGAGDEDHAVGLVNIAAKLFEVRFRESDHVEVQGYGRSRSWSPCRGTRSTASSPWMAGMMETRKSMKRFL